MDDALPLLLFAESEPLRSEPSVEPDALEVGSKSLLPPLAVPDEPVPPAGVALPAPPGAAEPPRRPPPPSPPVAGPPPLAGCAFPARAGAPDRRRRPPPPWPPFAVTPGPPPLPTEYMLPNENI